MVRFYALRVLKDYLGHAILIGLPLVLISVNLLIAEGADPNFNRPEAALFVGLVFIIMFQVFGAAYTHEGIEHDFFTPFKDRLRAAPVNPVRFLLMNIVYGTVISFLQGMVLLTFVVVVHGAAITNWVLVVLVLMAGAVFAQLLSAFVIMLLKQASKAQAVITLYAIGGTMVAGFFFPLPENMLTEALSKYSSPIAWQMHAIDGFMAQDFGQGMLGFGLVLGAIAILLIGLYSVGKRVVE